MIFLLYNLLFSITLPFWLPVVYLRARRRKLQPNWNERWGNFPLGFAKGDRRVWIHAVSVGEVLAVTPILRELRELLPQHEIVLSVTTSSGHTTAEADPTLYDHLVYFPFDLARPMLAAMQRVQPEVVAVMETELWPSLFWAAKVFEAKTMLINGRISDRSFPRAKAIRWAYKPVFDKLDRCLMQTDVDTERIQILGAKSAETLGNCKFDQATPATPPNPTEIRATFGIPESAPLLVIGSTRGEEEEKLVLEALHDLPEWKDGSLYVILAPRHLERADGLRALALSVLGVNPASRSLKESGRFLVLDTYGELGKLYAAADLAIIGGGFANLGGQNLIQPLANGVPVIHGPHMQNFRSAAAQAKAVGATEVAATAVELTDALHSLLLDGAKRKEMGRAAAELVRENLGASHRYAVAIAEAAKRK